MEEKEEDEGGSEGEGEMEGKMVINFKWRDVYMEI